MLIFRPTFRYLHRYIPDIFITKSQIKNLHLLSNPYRFVLVESNNRLSSSASTLHSCKRDDFE